MCHGGVTLPVGCRKGRGGPSPFPCCVKSGGEGLTPPRFLLRRVSNPLPKIKIKMRAHLLRPLLAALNPPLVALKREGRSCTPVGRRKRRGGAGSPRFASKEPGRGCDYLA